MNVTELKSLSVAVNPLAVIDRIIGELELTPTQYNYAVESYEAVAAALQKLHPSWQVSIFPQGSMRMGTTVRPIRGERFDLDMVCHLALSNRTFNPEQVFNLVWDALGQHETYRRSKRHRCIRLEYSAERKFYLDVTPAVPNPENHQSLFVPDREVKKWFSSHPIGYCDQWFKEAGKILPTIRRVLPLFANNRAMESALANAKASVEAMPEYGEFEKTPLQRIVQMLKRDRDEYFLEDGDHRPSSILLTTLTTHSYFNLVNQPATDLLEFVVKVVANLTNYISITAAPGSRKFYVLNPVNPEENFAENWTEEHHQRFLSWHKQISGRLQKLQQSKGMGADVMLNHLSEAFGNENVVRATRALGKETNALHDAGKLRVAGGVIGAVGTKVPITINFGK